MHGTPHIVSDVMTRTVVALARGATFKDIVKTMQRWKVSAMPVLEGDGRVAGIVSEADLLPKEAFYDGDPDLPQSWLPSTGGTPTTQLSRLADVVKAGAVTAEELMTAPALTVPTYASLGQAARIMALHRVKRLPVVNEEGALQGIVSRSDLLKVFLRDDEDIAEEVRREIVAVLFPASLDPIRVEVHDGVVKLTGRITDTTFVPITTRLVRAVQGVVDVDCALMGPHRRPDLDPDLPDGGTTAPPSGVGGAA